MYHPAIRTHTNILHWRQSLLDLFWGAATSRGGGGKGGITIHGVWLLLVFVIDWFIGRVVLAQSLFQADTLYFEALNWYLRKFFLGSLRELRRHDIVIEILRILSPIFLFHSQIVLSFTHKPRFQLKLRQLPVTLTNLPTIRGLPCTAGPSLHLNRQIPDLFFWWLCLDLCWFFQVITFWRITFSITLLLLFKCEFEITRWLRIVFSSSTLRSLLAMLINRIIVYLIYEWLIKGYFCQLTLILVLQLSFKSLNIVHELIQLVLNLQLSP